MGVKYSELPKTTLPTADDYVALLDNDSSTLKTTTAQNLVDCTLGTADISGLGDGTVKGAIVAAAAQGGGTTVLSITKAQYLANKEYYDNLDDVIEITDGSGVLGEVILTQEQYSALSEEEKNNGTTYYIKDESEPVANVYMTQAEYDALPDTKLTDNVVRGITDGGVEFSASNISYDGTGTLEEETTVQGAVDSLNASLTKLDYMKYDPETDLIYLKDADGVWHEWKSGGLLWDGVVFSNGAFSSKLEISQEQSGDWSSVGISNNYLRLTIYGKGSSATSWSGTYFINFTDAVKGRSTISITLDWGSKYGDVYIYCIDTDGNTRLIGSVLNHSETYASGSNVTKSLDISGIDGIKSLKFTSMAGQTTSQYFDTKISNISFT